MLTFALGWAALPLWEAQLVLVMCSEVGDTLGIGQRQRCGTLGLRRIDPDGVDLLLGLFGDVADQFDLALPAAREQRAGLAEVETGDVGFLVVGLGRNAQQF